MRFAPLVMCFALLLAACGSDASVDTAATQEETAAAAATAVPEPTATTATAAADTSTAEEPTAVVVEAAADSTETEQAEVAATSDPESFTIEVWADNWMAVYVDGVLVGEDSVSITTERSFNSETFTFEAAYPYTLAIEAKDFRETDSGLEYIGASNQQMGDGGIIAQVKDSSGNVVAVTNSAWAALVVHRAPLNTECEGDSDPNSTCLFEISETPADWTSVAFDSSGWANATVWSAADVDPKIGYDDISWDGSAELIWGTDLEVDNTILLRTVVAG